MNILAVAIAIIGTLFGAVGGLQFKKAARHFNFNLLEQIRNRYLISGFALFFFSTICYLAAIKLERLSLIYPINSLTYIWVAMISVFYLKEKMSRTKWMGIGLIMLGIALVASA